ncbi:Uncharacterised protein [Vibrio cholerae]|nr:Uncharacterised protein [Vibrio cholerae]
MRKSQSLYGWLHQNLFAGNQALRCLATYLWHPKKHRDNQSSDYYLCCWLPVRSGHNDES